MEQFGRTELLLGRDAMARLAESRVAVFGIGGVGGYVAEALVRSGVGSLELVDPDTVALSNLNRQTIATHSTLGRYKVDVMAERAKDINPAVEVSTRKCFFLPETAGEFDFTAYDYVVDAVDTVSAKLELAERCLAAHTPIISCMGTGNKLDPTQLRIADITKTSMCPLARVMRYELRRRGMKHLTVLYSTEEPLTPLAEEGAETPEPGRRAIPGSTAFVPAAAGLMIGGYVVRALAGEEPAAASHKKA